MVLYIFSQIVTFILFDAGLRKIIKEYLFNKRKLWIFESLFVGWILFLTYEIFSRFYPLRICFIKFSFFRDLLI
jgi:hypothetical protein